ncbi:MAG: hypothetical protein NTY03_17405 [Candidatus Bathyarchaeota archaeon]|nr:hypothetical protein [Candidatus Bathyarchaeota archaeon]
MVVLAEIQAAYYMVAVTGVLVAAYTIFSMNATFETRRIGLIVCVGMCPTKG